MCIRQLSKQQGWLLLIYNRSGNNICATIFVLQFDWLTYLRHVYNDTDVTIDTDEPVILWMKEYFDEFFDLVNRTSKRLENNFI